MQGRELEHLMGAMVVSGLKCDLPAGGYSFSSHLCDILAAQLPTRVRCKPRIPLGVLLLATEAAVLLGQLGLRVVMPATQQQQQQWWWCGVVVSTR